MVELVEVLALVLGVALDVLALLASFAAMLLVLPVWLSELLELVEGEEAAVLLVLDDWSLLAIAPVEDAVLEVELLALSVEAKPLVEPVWLKELLDVEDGEEEATLELLAVPLFWSELDAATEPDEEPSVAVFDWLVALPEAELPLIDAVEFWLEDGDEELIEALLAEPDEFSVFALELFEMFVLFELLIDVLLFAVSVVAALPLIEPEAEPAAFTL